MAEQIAQLEEATPVGTSIAVSDRKHFSTQRPYLDYDPEDIQNRDADEAIELDAAARGHYFEVGYAQAYIFFTRFSPVSRPSTLRNRLPSVADPKYEGVRVSRKQLLEDLDEASDDDEDNVEQDANDDEDAMDSEDERDGESLQENHDHTFERRLPSASEESDVEDEDEDVTVAKKPHREPSSESSTEQQPTDDMTSNLQKSRENDIKKGQAVKRQIVRIFLSISAFRLILTIQIEGIMGYFIGYEDTTSKVCSICQCTSTCELHAVEVKR